MLARMEPRCMMSGIDLGVIVRLDLVVVVPSLDQ